MEKKKASIVVKKIEDCKTLLDFLNVFYKDNRIAKVKNTSSLFGNFKMIEKFWDWIDAQDLSSERMEFLIDDFGSEKKKHFSKNPFVKTAFSDRNSKSYEDIENTIDYYEDEMYECN